MKIKEFIEWMQQDGLMTAVFQLEYERFCESVVECENMVKNGGFCSGTVSYNNMLRSYSELDGLLWGLSMAGYISQERRKELVEELMAKLEFERGK